MYNPGQKVLILKKGKGKMFPIWEKQTYKVVRQKGTALKLVSNSGDVFYRNVSHVRPYFVSANNQNKTAMRETIMRPHRRNINIPARFKDFHMGN